MCQIASPLFASIYRNYNGIIDLRSFSIDESTLLLYISQWALSYLLPDNKRQFSGFYTRENEQNNEKITGFLLLLNNILLVEISFFLIQGI